MIAVLDAFSTLCIIAMVLFVLWVVICVVGSDYKSNHRDEDKKQNNEDLYW